MLSDRISLLGNSNRQSGAELLKLFAMFLVVLSHVTQSLCVFATDSLINTVDIVHATNNFRNILVAWIRCSGFQGNLIFLCCSAWFLIDSSGVKAKKVTGLLADTWFASILFFGGGY